MFVKTAIMSLTDVDIFLYFNDILLILHFKNK